MASHKLFFSLVFPHLLTPTFENMKSLDQLRQERNLKPETEKLKTRQGSELIKEKKKENFKEIKGDELVDYCATLGEDDIRGKKPRFLAGNKVKAKKLKRSKDWYLLLLSICQLF